MWRGMCDTGRGRAGAGQDLHLAQPRARRQQGRPGRRIGLVPTLPLLHTPHCSTSVHALDALEAAGHDVAVRKYLLVKERLTEDELRSLAQRLQGDPPDALIRRDKTYADLGLQADGLGV